MVVLASRYSRGSDGRAGAPSKVHSGSALPSPHFQYVLWSKVVTAWRRELEIETLTFVR